MATLHGSLSPDLQAFIAAQKLFFVATAPNEGRLNVSPKGLDSLCVLDERTVAYLDHTGSGNETAAHLRQNGRMTLMFCSFDAKPLILRLYGRGRVVLPGAADWEGLRLHFPAMPGERQIMVLEMESCSTACGFGVPLFEFKANRTRLPEWAGKAGAEGLADYRRRNNLVSLDGLATGLDESEA
jgi:hypothetical protein